MYGNSPIGGDASPEPLSPTQRRRLKRDLAAVAARTREYLPGEYVVGSELSTGTDGPQATVAVRPPAGHPVSAGFTPDGEEFDGGLDEGERDEVARGLAASAAVQVMNAVGDGVSQTAR